MHRLGLGLLVVVALAGCGSEGGSQTGGPTGQLASVVVTFDDDGAKGSDPPRTAKIECAKPSDSQICGAIAGISAADIQKPPGDIACTQQFGGPEEASIKGTIRGETVDASFSRRDGCEIARWDRVQELLHQVR